MGNLNQQKQEMFDAMDRAGYTDHHVDVIPFAKRLEQGNGWVFVVDDPDGGWIVGRFLGGSNPDYSGEPIAEAIEVAARY